MKLNISQEFVKPFRIFIPFLCQSLNSNPNFFLLCWHSQQPLSDSPPETLQSSPLFSHQASLSLKIPRILVSPNRYEPYYRPDSPSQLLVVDQHHSSATVSPTLHSSAAISTIEVPVGAEVFEDETCLGECVVDLSNDRGINF